MSEPKRPDNILGYEHPNNTNFSNNSGIYKTFSEKRKKKSGKTVLNKKYTTFTENEQNLCPLCNEQTVHICNCIYNDKHCKNGHIWYTDREGNIKNGNPHKNK